MEPLKTTALTLASLVALAVLSIACNMPSVPTSPPFQSNLATSARNNPAPPTSLPPSPIPVPIRQTSAQVPTRTPTTTATPRITRLTEGSCCSGIFWAPDSSAVWYIDRPAPEGPSGIWGVGLHGEPPVFVTDRLGIYSGDMAYRAFPQNEMTVIERMADGQRWNLANGARAVAFSPDDQYLAWVAGQSGPPFDTPLREIWISNIDGTGARQVQQVYGGGLLSWRSADSLLINGRETPDTPHTSLWSLSIDTGAMDELLQVPGLRGASLSPDQRWLAFQVVFSGEAESDGLWLADLETGDRRRLDLFGAYQWRTAGLLLVIPFEPGASAHSLWDVDALTREERPLTDPQATPIQVANGDWMVSPDGQYLAWVSALDHNIWLMTLPN